MSTPTLQTIKVERLAKRAVLLTYNQPQISNAFTVQQYLDLTSALKWVLEQPKITVAVLTGAGKHYCAGKVLQSPDDGGPTIDQEIEAGRALGDILQTFSKILIAAVNGAAVGWGCTQLWNFDLVYASSMAFFQTPFTKLGFVPEGGSSFTFPRLMGRQRAMKLLLASERVSANEMHSNGLVTEVIDDRGNMEDFLQQVCNKAITISEYNEESLQLVKELTTREQELQDMRTASDKERKALSRMLNSDAAKAMMVQFAERSKKRKRDGRL